jgi:hypothetical protein
VEPGVEGVDLEVDLCGVDLGVGVGLEDEDSRVRGQAARHSRVTMPSWHQRLRDELGRLQPGSGRMA